MTSWTLRHTVGAAVALIAAGTFSAVTVGASAQAVTPHQAGTHVVVASREVSTKKFTFVTAGTQVGGKASQQAGLFHGAINGGGKDVPLAQSDVVHLAGGSITVKHPDGQSTYTPHLDKATCYVTFTITGKLTLTDGTGSYHGVTGAGTYVGHGYGYLARTKSGACKMTAAPTSEVFEITAKGVLD